MNFLILREVKMWFKPKSESTAEQVKIEREKWLQAMFEKSQELELLIKVHHTGWSEFREILNDYIDKAKKRKLVTALDTATDNDIFQLKLLDHEIYILSWVLKIPEQFIGKIEAEIKKNNEEEK
jgi:ethanolamine utilization protein EutP (predicted NTPase)